MLDAQADEANFYRSLRRIFMSDAASRWGLPSGFTPVLMPLPDEVKAALRPLLQPNEPVIISLTNEGNSVHLVATTERLFTVRSGMTAGTGGMSVREYSWAAIADLKMLQSPLNVKITISFHSRDGKKPESGPRAKQWKLHTDQVMPFETARGAQAFEALQNVWIHKTRSELYSE
jgi:hypothetical protein